MKIKQKVMNIMNQSDLEALIRQSLDDFYRRRTRKLTELKLSNVLRKKNPYLLRAVGVRKASEIVKSFKNNRFEPINWAIPTPRYPLPIGVVLCIGGWACPRSGWANRII